MIALPVTCPIFIGRREELEFLNDARRALARSRGSFVLVGGDAGIGKSRLVSQFVHRSGDRRVRNLAVAECREDVAEPLRPVRSVVDLLLSIDRPTLPASAQRALDRIAADSASMLERESSVSPIDRTDLYLGLWSVFAAFAAKRATILVFEDIHWADSSTLEFLAYIAPRVAGTRVLVIATHRAEALETFRPLRNALSRIEREPTVRRIELEPFGGIELRELLVAALGERAPLEASAVERILTRSEGNAFFAEELLKEALASRGRDDARLPISIRGTIMQRLETFVPFDRRVLSFAAVLGSRFDPMVLAAILECDIDRVLPALHFARDAAILIEDALEPKWMRFRHALTRQVVYDDLLALERQRLHRRIVDVLEREDSVAPGRLYALAEHAAAAGDRARTLSYGERAGNAAWMLGGFAEAIASFERALAVAQSDLDRARLLESLAFPVAYGGDPRRAVGLWESAIALRVARGEFTDAARLYQEVICERFSLDDLQGRDDAAMAFVADHAAHIRGMTRDSVHGLVACVRSELGDVAAVDAPLRLIEDPDGMHPLTKQNLVRADMHVAAYHGRADAWRNAFDRLIALAPFHENASVDAYNVVGTLASAALSGLHLDVHAEVESALERGGALAAEWGFARFESYFAALDAAYLLSRGRLSLARARLTAIADSDDYLAKGLIARSRPFLALALDDDTLVDASDSDDAVRDTVEALARNARTQYGRLLVGGHALWLRRCGRVRKADELLHAALDGLADPSPRFASLLCSALRHFGVDRVPNLEAFAATERRDPRDAVGRAAALLAGAARSRCAGDDAAADRGFRLAASAFTKFGFDVDAAHAYHLGGDVATSRALYLACGASAYAFDERPLEQTSRARTSELSDREETVARYVALGLTNGAIAQRMSVSTKTVEKYLASVFRKFGLRSRSQVAARLAAGTGRTIESDAMSREHVV